MVRQQQRALVRPFFGSISSRLAISPLDIGGQAKRPQSLPLLPY